MVQLRDKEQKMREFNKLIDKKKARVRHSFLGKVWAKAKLPRSDRQNILSSLFSTLLH